MRVWILSAVIMVVLAGCAGQASSTPVPATPTASNVGVNPVELVNFFNSITQNGGTIQAPAWSNIHTLLIPDSTEVDIKELDVPFMQTLKSTLETGKGFSDGDINLVFTAPKDHKILVVDRTANIPAYLLKTSEVTFDIQRGILVTIINLGGPQKKLGPEFTRSWHYAQTMCLSYTFYVADADSQCNVFAANAAAAWIGLPRDQAEAAINSLGATTVAGGNRTYRFLAAIYDTYYRKH